MFPPVNTSVFVCEYGLRWGRFEKRNNCRSNERGCIAICKLFWYIWGFVNRQIWFSHSLVTIQRGRIIYIKNNFYSRVTSTGMYTKHLPFKLKHWSSCNLLAFGRIARSTIGHWGKASTCIDFRVYYFAGNRFKDSKLKASIVQSLREKGHNVTDNKASVTDVNGVSYFQEKISAHADSRRGGAQGSAQFWLLHWVVIMNFRTWGDLTHTLWKIVRLVSSRYLRGYFFFVPSLSPCAPQPNPILLSCPKHVSSDWVRVWMAR